MYVCILEFCSPPRSCWRSTTPICRRVRSSPVLSSTWAAAPLCQWSGRVWTLWRLVVRFWAPPIRLIQLRAPFVVICACRSVATFCTDPMPSSPPRRRSLCGSPRRSWSNGHRPTKVGCTSKSSLRLRCDSRCISNLYLVDICIREMWFQDEGSVEEQNKASEMPARSNRYRVDLDTSTFLCAFVCRGFVEGCGEWVGYKWASL